MFLETLWFIHQLPWTLFSVHGIGPQLRQTRYSLVTADPPYVRRKYVILPLPSSPLSRTPSAPPSRLVSPYLTSHFPVPPCKKTVFSPMNARYTRKALAKIVFNSHTYSGLPRFVLVTKKSGTRYNLRAHIYRTYTSSANTRTIDRALLLVQQWIITCHSTTIRYYNTSLSNRAGIYMPEVKAVMFIQALTVSDALGVF